MKRRCPFFCRTMAGKVAFATWRLPKYISCIDFSNKPMSWSRNLPGQYSKYKVSPTHIRYCRAIRTALMEAVIMLGGLPGCSHDFAIARTKFSQHV